MRGKLRQAWREHSYITPTSPLHHRKITAGPHMVAVMSVQSLSPGGKVKLGARSRAAPLCTKDR